MPAVIHVKLSGEGDFGPVDLECAIPPARLPVVMAALFGSAQSGAVMAHGRLAAGAAVGGKTEISANASQDVHRADAASGEGLSAQGAAGPANANVVANEGIAVGSDAVDPGMFITGFVGSFEDLVGRLHPRGFAEIILLAAIWLQYRDGRNFVTRGDIRRLLRRQDHLRMPRNFSRDFHAAVARGYLEEVENEDGYTVASDGFIWFRKECTK
ncbi:hypothetical protein [Thalassospira sp.]|uniref:hypothetical protein n=1 Tax=Thalassospira sp. TaxID=1912094 RepID=UPI001B0C1E4F|nr:hypothetical protein [Thalassospira sp.]MBO6807516.1 hypothetical protein [Thalassospira sp.]MBO6840041.1 hypothetical protein [Thalassospira sp.]